MHEWHMCMHAHMRARMQITKYEKSMLGLDPNAWKLDPFLAGGASQFLAFTFGEFASLKEYITKRGALQKQIDDDFAAGAGPSYGHVCMCVHESLCIERCPDMHVRSTSLRRTEQMNDSLFWY